MVVGGGGVVVVVGGGGGGGGGIAAAEVAADWLIRDTVKPSSVFRSEAAGPGSPGRDRMRARSPLPCLKAGSFSSPLSSISAG